MIKLRRFNKIFHCSFFIFLIGKTSLSISAENAQITPNPPIENIPIIAGIEWTEGVTRTSYRWIVNDIDGTQRESPETFHVNFESRFTPQNGDVLLDSLGAELRSSWFGTGVHIGNGPAQLTYNAVGNISLDSGTVSLWFALDEDITHPIYDNWNRLFEYRIDDNNALYIEFSKDSDIITGVSQNESGYTGAWYLFAPIYQSDWHHLVWTWDTHTHTQNLYLDGKIKCQDSNFEPPIGTSDTFHIGCAYWGSPNGYATIDEFRLYNRALKSYEIKALYLFPDQDIDAVLEPSMFNSGDAIQFIYKTFNGQSWSMESSIGPFSVISHPIVESNLINDVLPVGSTTASFSLETAIPAQCHCDTINVPYNQMTYELQGSGTMDHQFSCPVQINQSYSYFIRCAPDSNPNAPWPFVLQSNTHVLRDYNPQYPRIFSLWWNYDDQINTPSDLAKYDLAVLFWGAVQNPGDVLFEAREQNPNLKALITYNFSYGSPEDQLFEAVATDPNDPLYNCVLCDPNGHVLYEGFWGHSMYNLTNPVCVDYMANRILSQWRNDCLFYDGIYFDRVQGNVFWMWNTDLDDRNIDIDQDGLGDDYEIITSAWQNGVTTLLMKIRERAPNAVICGNDAIYLYSPWMHGRLFEMGLNQISSGHAPYRPLIEEYIGWRDVHREPWALPLITGQGPDWLWTAYGTNPSQTCPPDTVQWVQEQVDRMRFGLCSALMGDGLYSYDFGTTWWGHNWWYDEYNVNLGMPTGDGYALNDLTSLVSQDDFEDGSLGNFMYPTWLQIASVTNDPDHVISGKYSLYAENSDPSREWNEFLWSDTNKIPFQPNTQYIITWKYRIIKEAENGHFYALLRTNEVSPFHDIWWKEWDPIAGTVDSVRSIMNIDSYDNYYLIFGIQYDGAVALDDITISLGGEPVWRRDFEEGIALVNPSDDTAHVNLEFTYWAISGTQDPVVNHGGEVHELDIPPFDGRVLLKNGGMNVQLDNQNSRISLSFKVYPNPCNAETTFEFTLPENKHIELKIFDLLGRQVRTLENRLFRAGKHHIHWDGNSDDLIPCPSGLYLVRFKADKEVWNRKMMIIR